MKCAMVIQSIFTLIKNCLKTYNQAFGLLKKIFINIFGQSLIFFGLLCFFQINRLSLLYRSILPHEIGNLDYLYHLLFFVYIFIFLLFIAYVLATYQKKHKYKIIIIIISICLELVIGAYVINKEKNWDLYLYDGLIQTKVAANYILDGKNPYQENYYQTELDTDYYRNAIWVDRDNSYQMINPALEHYVYFPLYFLLPAGLSLIIPGLNTLVGLRLYLLFFLLIGAWVIYKIPANQEKKLILLIATTFPLLPAHMLTFGYFDSLPLALLIFGLYFLKKQKLGLSLFWLCLAALVKQNYLFYILFFYGYVFYKFGWTEIRKKLLRPLILVPVFTFGLILLPFIIWCPSCFYQDTFYYLSHIYPIRGIGLSVPLQRAGMPASPFDYWPYWRLQAIWLILTVPYLLYRQKKHNTLKSILLYGSIVMGGYWYLSRYFIGTHFLIVLQNIIIALFL